MLGGNGRRMPTDTESLHTLPINSRTLVVSDAPLVNCSGQHSPFTRGDVQHDMYAQQAEIISNHSQKLKDDLQEMGEKIKHHEHNVKYLKSLTNKLDDSIIDIQVAIGKCHASFPKGENEDSALQSEEETIQCILKFEKSAAAILCTMKSEPDTCVSHPVITKDVLGVVATLGKLDDANLSRLLSEYLGLDTMLAVVCKTYESIKALEAYKKDGSINKGLGIHAFAESIGRHLDERFSVICLENLRPYAGELIVDDPQRRLDLLKPRLTNGETPPGFLGFAVNMITIDKTNLYCISKSGHNLRQTLFYNLFSTLQVYRSREDMLKALPFITNGAISLDGGIVRSPGIFSLGHHREDISVKFPCDSKKPTLPVSYFEMEKQLKEAKWKKGRTEEDMKMEQELLDHARLKFETKKKEFVQFLAESSSFATQVQVGRVSTPR